MYSRLLWQLTVALPFTFAVVVGFTDSKRVFAQLTPDDTLGRENSIVTPQQLRDLIQGGAIRDGALFHSFEEFNVGSDRGVFFDLQNNTDILNIFTRVTGGNVSNILGTLGVLQDALNSDVLGNANLFLLNPNGITFGANANLQLNGSFFATTADGFGFENFTFSASRGETPPPLLTISIPSFLDFRNNAGNIAVNGSSLRVNQGQNLSLVGGNVNVNNANLTASGGTIQIAGLSGNRSVYLSFDGFSLGFGINAQTLNYGSVTINSSDVNTDNNDVVTGVAGGIYLDAVEEIRVTNNSTLSSNGDFGIIDLGFRITPNTITINNSALSTDLITDITLPTQNSQDFFISAGNITIDAANTIIIDNSTLTAQENTGVGFSGSIQMLANREISIENNSILNASGDFGIVDLGFPVYPDTLTVSNSTITTQSNLGSAGIVYFNARNLIRIEDSEINSEGGFGTIIVGDINVQETLIISNSTLTTDSSTDTSDAGFIEIDAREEIIIENESTLSSIGNFGTIAVGRVFSEGPDTVYISNSEITTNATSNSIDENIFEEIDRPGENDSDLILQDNDLEILQRFAGIIAINAQESISIENNSKITSNGNIGSIRLGTGSIGFFEFEEVEIPEIITITQSQLSANNQDGFAAGTIEILTENLTLDEGEITATTSGSGGNIQLTVENLLLLLNGSRISTNASDVGIGGNIDISATLIVAFPDQNSDITSNAQGQAGRIRINNAEGVFGFEIREDDLDSDNLEEKDLEQSEVKSLPFQSKILH